MWKNGDFCLDLQHCSVEFTLPFWSSGVTSNEWMQVLGNNLGYTVSLICGIFFSCGKINVKFISLPYQEYFWNVQPSTSCYIVPPFTTNACT